MWTRSTPANSVFGPRYLSEALFSLPLRAQQRHDELVPVDATKKRTATRYSFRLEADTFVGSASAAVLRKDPQPKTPRVSFLECGVDDLAQERPAVAAARTRNGNPLHQRDALRRVPIAQNREADGLRAIPSNEIGVPAIGKGGAVTRLIPMANEILESGKTFRRHDETDHRFVATHDDKRPVTR